MNKSGTWIFSASVFLGAFLLFEIQPIAGKALLPLFGSVASVWTTCLMFFQLLLFAGCAYVYGLGKLSPGRQVGIHAAVMLLAASWACWGVWNGVLAPYDAERIRGWGGGPVTQVLCVLAMGVGVPCFLLATNSSILQLWARLAEPEKEPYYLYVVSNAGSLLALVIYPFLVEPAFTVRFQFKAWETGFMGFVILTAMGVWVYRKALPGAAGRTTADRATAQSADISPLGWSPILLQRVLWLILAACGCVLLMSVTNLISQDICPAPLLWVLPLSLYLLSFIAGFSARLEKARVLYGGLLLAGMAVAGWLMRTTGKIPLAWEIGAYAFVMFTACLFCHASLYRLRPRSAEGLPLFYLTISAGGAIGGAFVGVAAPLIFPWYWEYYLGLLLVCGLWIVMTARESRGWFARAWYVGLVVPLILADSVLRDMQTREKNIIEHSRNFYGTLQVHRQVNTTPGGIQVVVSSLINGAITHGIQADKGPFRYGPTAYFSEDSGVGLAFAGCPSRLQGKPLKIGDIGLGIGTVAAYLREGDWARFYEINPEVIRYAEDRQFFTYLVDCKGKVEVVCGDGRLALERDVKGGLKGSLDIMVLDAFTGDAIPTHLLTEEAFALYLEALKPHGIIAWHVGNRYVDLVPLAAALADRWGLGMAVIDAPGDFRIKMASRWILMTRNIEFLASEEIAKARRKDTGDVRKVKLWTDDFSNVMSLMKR